MFRIVAVDAIDATCMSTGVPLTTFSIFRDGQTSEITPIADPNGTLALRGIL